MFDYENMYRVQTTVTIVGVSNQKQTRSKTSFKVQALHTGVYCKVSKHSLTRSERNKAPSEKGC